MNLQMQDQVLQQGTVILTSGLYAELIINDQSFKFIHL